MEIPGTEFLMLDWIIRSIRLTTVWHRCVKNADKEWYNFRHSEIKLCNVLQVKAVQQPENLLKHILKCSPSVHDIC